MAKGLKIIAKKKSGYSNDEKEEIENLIVTMLREVAIEKAKLAGLLSISFKLEYLDK